MTCTGTSTVSSRETAPRRSRPGLVGQRAGVAQRLPQLLGQVRGKGRQQQHELLHRRPRPLPRLRKKLVNSIIRAMAVLNDICSTSAVTAWIVLCSMRFCSARGLDVADGRVELHGLGPIVDDHPPHAVQEAAHAAHAVHAPGLDGLQRAHEHLVQPQGVGPVFGHHLVGIDHVAAALGHLVRPAVDADRRIGLEHEAVALLFHLVRPRPSPRWSGSPVAFSTGLPSASSATSAALTQRPSAAW